MMEYPVEPEILGDPPLKLVGDDPKDLYIKDLYIIDSPSVADCQLETKNEHSSKST